MFHVGQMVVCVHEMTWPRNDGETFPVKGGIYTIRHMRRGKLDAAKWYLLLEEIVNSPLRENGTLEVGFWSGRFRPVRKTDISIFTSMLFPIPTEKVGA